MSAAGWAGDNDDVPRLGVCGGLPGGQAGWLRAWVRTSTIDGWTTGLRLDWDAEHAEGTLPLNTLPTMHRQPTGATPTLKVCVLCHDACV